VQQQVTQLRYVVQWITGLTSSTGVQLAVSLTLHHRLSGPVRVSHGLSITITTIMNALSTTVTYNVVNRRTVQWSRGVMDNDVVASVLVRSIILRLSLVSNSEQETSLRSPTTASLVRKRVHIILFTSYEIQVTCFRISHLMFCRDIKTTKTETIARCTYNTIQ